MHGTARGFSTGKLDVIVYRSDAHRPFYVSEHAISQARAPDLYESLKLLSRQVQIDVADRLYSLPSLRPVRTFATLARVALELREGRKVRDFLCRVDELEDDRGWRSFEASCPTNYLGSAGSSMDDAVSRLGEIIAARYAGESVSDLLRDLPKCPYLTGIDLGPEPGPTRRMAVVRQAGTRFVAAVPDVPLTGVGNDAFEALVHLEEGFSSLDLPPSCSLGGEPLYTHLTVPMLCGERSSSFRFLASIAPCSEEQGEHFFQACAPQAGVLVKAPSFESAIAEAKAVIAEEFREKSLRDVRKAMAGRVFLSTVRTPGSRK